MYFWSETREHNLEKKRYIYELYETFNEPNIVTYIEVKRLTWAGHLVRMNDRTLKKIFNTKPDGVRSVGRLKLRWEDSVDQGIRILGVNGRKSPSTERNGQSFLRPGPTKGC
jgi:hypothetical protein